MRTLATTALTGLVIVTVPVVCAPTALARAGQDDRAPERSAARMQGAFGNTIVSHYSRGRWVRHYFEPDGRYSSQFWDGRAMTARWAVEGDKVCLSNIRPRQVLSRFCTELVSATIGGEWQSRDPLGREVRNVLVAGRR